MRIQDKLIDEFFEIIKKEVLPSLILSENKDIGSEIFVIKDMFYQAKEDMKKIDPSLGDMSLGSEFFISEFKKEVKKIAQYIESRTKSPHFVYELTPVLNEISALVDKNFFSIALKVYEKQQIEQFNNTPKNNLIFQGFNFLKEKFFPKEPDDSISSIKENLWEQLAKNSITKLVEDFDLKSVSIMGEQPWSEVYSWANDTYRVIKDAQESIGLSQKSAGINKSLNLAYSPDSLFYKSSYGSMLTHEFSNTITLTQQPYEVQKSTWQHEYTHALDNRSSIKYLKEIGIYTNGNNSQNTFLSSLEISMTLLDFKFPQSHDENTQQAQIWTSEALSIIVNGKNTDDFKSYQKEAENNFLKELSQYLIISFLPNQEKSWMNLSSDTQNNILNNIDVKDFTKYISINIYKKGDKFLPDLFNNKSEDLSEITEKLKKISALICPLLNQDGDTFLYQTITTIDKNKNHFTKDLKAYLNKHSYSFDNNITYFPTSESIKHASTEALNFNRNYWIMPMEILARASENLQQPLLIGTQEFHDNKDYIKTQLVPQLNKEERIVLLYSLQSMAKSIGLEIIKAPEDVKAVEKQLNYSEEMNFSNIALERLKSHSTASGDEDTSQILLKIAKLRASSHSITHKKL